jgi:hypothetical protein
MKTKLTLRLDEEVIKKAKKYAQSHHTSISELLENYLKLLVSRDKKLMAEDDPEEYSSITQLRGIIKLPKNFDYKKELGKMLRKRYEKLK